MTSKLLVSVASSVGPKPSALDLARLENKPPSWSNGPDVVSGRLNSGTALQFRYDEPPYRPGQPPPHRGCVFSPSTGPARPIALTSFGHFPESGKGRLASPHRSCFAGYQTQTRIRSRGDDPRTRRGASRQSDLSPLGEIPPLCGGEGALRTWELALKSATTRRDG